MLLRVRPAIRISLAAPCEAAFILMTPEAAIRQRALALGFDACHITSSEPPASVGHYRDWLAAGRQGEMAYMERTAAKRSDLQLVLPDARSVIVLAASYAGPGENSKLQTPNFTDHAPSGNFKLQTSNVNVTDYASRITSASLNSAAPCPEPLAPLSQPIARYARAHDYHEVLGTRVAELARCVDELGGPGTSSRWYVDTGPVLERDLAQRSGLGFLGKHTNLISRQFGNWIFLAEILTTLPLEADLPEKNRCGSCTRCLAACPTGAIVAPFQLDARRCISYLTIELKGAIPIPWRAAIGHRIFGCDDCLAVCPWNRFAQAGKLMQEQGRPDLELVDLLELLALDGAGFKARFGGTPIQRIKRRSLRRNVCVALGNTGDATALPALNQAAADPDPLIAEHAQWALAQIRARSGRGVG